MKLIVGLGNPASLYKNTRHNIGRLIVEEMARLYRIKIEKDRSLLSSLGKGRIEDIDFILAYPLVFMNLSGESVRNLKESFQTENKEILVICDDLDLKLGTIRIKPKGGDAGHKGLRSIINSLGSNNFCRLRIGIGRTPDKEKIKDFVLSKFRSEEKNIIAKVKKKAIDCCRVWLLEGVESAMNKFN